MRFTLEQILLVFSLKFIEVCFCQQEFQNVLYSDKELGVIDIGANIGVYSLVALAMGHQVLAVEPLQVCSSSEKQV